MERQWTAVGLAVRPADRDRAERGMALAYAEAGLRPPGRVLWAGSPAAGASLAAEIAPEAGPSLRHAIRDQPWARRRAEVHARLGAEGWSALWAATGARSWALVVDQMLAPLRSRLVAELPASARAALLDAAPGQHDAAWLVAFAAADHQATAPTEPTAPTAPTELAAPTGLAGLAEVTQSCGWWWAFPEVAILTERPVTLVRDNVGRLHRANEAALAYPDGFAVHAWRGIPVAPDLARRLRNLALSDITAEPNAEVRRVMLEHFGYERYLREAGASRSSSDEFGTVWTIGLANDEPLTMVEVVNATAEPDGTHRTYWLRVPPGTRTPREGIAWTFGLTEAEYAPLVQT